jgi:DNA repair protein RadC
MRNSKKQFAMAELTFCYSAYPKHLNLNTTHKIRQLLLRLWQNDCQCQQARCYVLFLDAQGQFITWKALSPCTSHNGYAREITGMAMACHASSIILSHNRLYGAKPNMADRTLISHVFVLCEYLSIEILDYLIVTSNQCTSFKNWLSTN